MKTKTGQVLQFDEEYTFIVENSKSQESIKKEKDTSTVQTMIAATYDEPQTNARTRARSTGYVLPFFNGYIKYKSLCNKKQLDAGGLLIPYVVSPVIANQLRRCRIVTHDRFASLKRSPQWVVIHDRFAPLSCSPQCDGGRHAQVSRSFRPS